VSSSASLADQENCARKICPPHFLDSPMATHTPRPPEIILPSDSELRDAQELALGLTGSEVEAGILRQVLGPEQKPLSSKQHRVYEKRIEPSLWETCGNCPAQIALGSGGGYCPTCEIEYGG
jgi:hypothetical protein